MQRFDVMSFFLVGSRREEAHGAGAAGPLGCRLVRRPLVLVCMVLIGIVPRCLVKYLLVLCIQYNPIPMV